jgi:hypothetical protein
VRLGEKARQYETGRVDRDGRDATQSPHTRTSSLNKLANSNYPLCSLPSPVLLLAQNITQRSGGKGRVTDSLPSTIFRSFNRSRPFFPPSPFVPL